MRPAEGDLAWLEDYVSGTDDKSYATIGGSAWKGDF